MYKSPLYYGALCKILKGKKMIKTKTKIYLIFSFSHRHKKDTLKKKTHQLTGKLIYLGCDWGRGYWKEPEFTTGKVDKTCTGCTCGNQKQHMRFGHGNMDGSKKERKRKKKHNEIQIIR